MNKVLLLAATMLVALLGLSGSAFAATGFERVGAFAEAYPDGQPAHQKRIAVNHASGDVYVTDQVNDQIAVYHPNGTGADPLTTFGSGDLTDPFGIAIDQSNGDVYVADVNGIVKYDSDGATTPTFTKDGAFSVTGVTGALAFDASSDSLLIADTAGNTVRRYSTVGGAGATFDGSAGIGSPGAFVGLQDLAVDSTGDVIVVDASSDPASGYDAGSSRVLRYASDGDFQATIGPVTRAATVAVRPSSDEVIVSGEQNVVYIGGVPKLHVFAPDGTPEFVTGVDDGGTTQSATVSGIASATGADGQLFVATDNADWRGDYSYGYVSVQVFNAFVLPLAVVSDEAATPTEIGAKLSAKVNPNRSTTTWTFEYGTSTSYGKQFPVTPATIPAGTDPVAVTRTIGGLQPGTTYHYRVVATNGAGTNNGDDHTFTTKSFEAPGSAAGRAPGAFEMVTPVDKGGYSIDPLLAAKSSPSGDAVAYGLGGTLPGAPSSTKWGHVIARRSADGWNSASIEAPLSTDRHYLLKPSLALSDDLSQTFQFGTDVTVPGTSNSGGGNLYLRDNLTGVRRLVWASDATPPFTLRIDLVNPGAQQVFGSSDLSHVAFYTAQKLLPEAASGQRNVYEVVDGVLRLVSILPDGSVAPDSLVASDGIRGAYYRPTGRSVSEDGRRVNFTTAGDGALYQRIDGSRTVLISASQRPGDPATPRDARYQGASSDGRFVFFTANSGMTSAGEDDDVYLSKRLYRYDVDGDQLLDLTPSPIFGNSSDTAFDQNVVVSRDGRTVAFLGDGKLTPVAEPDQNNAYVWHDGVVRWLGAVAANGDFSSQGGVAGASFSPNGQTFAFSTASSMTGFDNRSSACAAVGSSDPGPCREVYVYDVASDTLRCPTCDSSTTPRQSNTETGSLGTNNSGPRSVFDDGSVLFNSKVRLVAGDTNIALDVYRWSVQTGPQLVSAGSGSVDSTFADASADGKTVFFRTADQLVTQDRDQIVDLYALRVGGGIAAQNPPPSLTARCDGDACQGLPSASAAPVVAASVTFAGLGDPPPPGAPVAVIKPKITLTQKKVSGGSFTIAVKVPGRGTITASGTGLRTVKKAVSKPATYSVKLTLTARARARLARTHMLPVTVHVAYKPVGGAVASGSLKVTLTQPKANKKSSERLVRRAAALSLTSAKGR